MKSSEKMSHQVAKMDGTKEASKKRPVNDVNDRDEEYAKKLRPCLSVQNRYNGWVVPNKDYTIPKIPLKSLTTNTKFFDEYVKQRRPVVLEGTLEDLDGLKKWQHDNDHLRKLAGKESVMVEVRKEQNESFGRGNETPMAFEQFLDLVEAGDAKHYLTTQDVEANEDGQPDLMAPFMKALKGDFPLRPKITGNLIPQNINLWMGNNAGDGVSSGLHHDYHDNLYIILRGRKRFRLYSPKDTKNLYPNGTLFQIHTNGRINYDGEETTAYGADLKADAAAQAAKAKEIAEQKLTEAEKAVEEGKPGAGEDLEQAEKMLEEAMDALIDAEMDENEEEFDDDDDNDDDEKGNGEECNLSLEEESEAPNRLVDKTVKDPNNFSRVSVGDFTNSQVLQQKFPKFNDATPAFCELKVGEILYIPASWWHEVTSFGSKEGHLALNYWFHPPNTEDFNKPYSSDFWQNDYDMRFNVMKI